MNSSGERWWICRTGREPADFNMAFDEALMAWVGREGRPMLRFYGWSEPAASFGYSQRFEEVSRWTLLRPLVRRPTGGGLVPHDADWTYSVAVPPGHWWYELKAVESYRTVHAWIAAAFGRLGVEMELSPCCRKEIPGQCFVGAEQDDVLWRGRKVAGAAQRRSREGLLIQGSVQPPPIGLDRAGWERAMEEEATERWGVGWDAWSGAAEFAGRVEVLRREKHGRAAYQQRR